VTLVSSPLPSLRQRLGAMGPKDGRSRLPQEVVYSHAYGGLRIEHVGYEFRHVHLDKATMKKYWAISDKGSKLLTESQWRDKLGLEMSPGWQNYSLCVSNEPHILLFKKPAKVAKELAEQPVEQAAEEAPEQAQKHIEKQVLESMADSSTHTVAVEDPYLATSPVAGSSSLANLTPVDMMGNVTTVPRLGKRFAGNAVLTPETAIGRIVTEPRFGQDVIDWKDQNVTKKSRSGTSGAQRKRCTNLVHKKPAGSAKHMHKKPSCKGNRDKHEDSHGRK